MAFPAPPQPKTLLGRHRLLAPSASIRVSPICLGGMSFGTQWTKLLGEANEPLVSSLLDKFYNLGGNFIDTANMYQGGQSEEYIGNWLAKHDGRRDEMVVATKYSLDGKMGHPGQHSNFGGTGSKTLMMSLRESLARLKTGYVDILYVHAWDYAVQIPELMQSLNAAVQSGLVLYLGICNTPAWIVAKANAYARQHGLRPFSVYQGAFGAHNRDLERDVIPMCRDEGMAVLAYGVIGGGYLIPAAEKDADRSRNAKHMLNGREEAVGSVLSKVAQQHKATVPAVAIAYVMQKTPYLIPLLGGRSEVHLEANIAALSLNLSEEDIDTIDKAYDFDIGYPMNFIGTSKVRAPTGPADSVTLKRMGHFDYVQDVKAIAPGRVEAVLE